METPQHGKIDTKRVEPDLFFQGRTDSFKIAGRVFEGWWHQFDPVLFHRRVDGDVKGSWGLAHHLLTGPRRFRNKNEKVSFHGGHAAHAIALFSFFR